MNTKVEKHPLQPFLPTNSRVLMLGSFPPPKMRWSMNFFYPNYINDMWRVMGYIFYCDRLHFVDEPRRTFRLDDIRTFLEEKGIALYDTATEVRRLKENASDKFLEIARSTDIAALSGRLPELRAIVTTGQKATDTLLESLLPHCGKIESPAVGGYTPFILHNRKLMFYRMPSTSRAYPLALEKKAAHYARMFREIGIIP